MTRVSASLLPSIFQAKMIPLHLLNILVSFLLLSNLCIASKRPQKKYSGVTMRGNYRCKIPPIVFEYYTYCDETTLLKYDTTPRTPIENLPIFREAQNARVSTGTFSIKHSTSTNRDYKENKEGKERAVGSSIPDPVLNPINTPVPVTEPNSDSQKVLHVLKDSIYYTNDNESELRQFGSALQKQPESFGSIDRKCSFDSKKREPKITIIPTYRTPLYELTEQVLYEFISTKEPGSIKDKFKELVIASIDTAIKKLGMQNSPALKRKAFQLFMEIFRKARPSDPKERKAARHE